MTATLAGKVALVTGAGTGIGKALPSYSREREPRLFVSDVNAEGGEATARLIRESGGDAVFVKADVLVASEVEALINKAVAAYGRLADVIVIMLTYYVHSFQR